MSKPATSETEGVIRFAYDLQTPDSAIVDEGTFGQLRAWRDIFIRLGIVGQQAERYQGLGFGNLSARDAEQPDEFVITASQTGTVTDLRPRHLTRITGFNLERFWVEARGTAPPSSETMTHAAIYAADSRIQWVFHCHTPDVFSHAEELALPCTDPQVPYGSTAMVAATRELLANHHSRPLVFATLGHADGVFGCGPTARDAGGLLVSYLAKALTF